MSGKITSKDEFNKIKIVKQFQENVPLQIYEDYRGYMDKIKTTGMQNILTRDSEVFLAVTSGTTGDYKVLPITMIHKSRHSLLTLLLVVNRIHRSVW